MTGRALILAAAALIGRALILAAAAALALVAPAGAPLAPRQRSTRAS